MKTVAQIAREIGVSKQAIHNKIKREPLQSKLQGLTATVDNALHINIDGERLIKSAFSKNSSTEQLDELTTFIDESTNAIDKPSTGVDEATSELVKALKEQITMLTAQNEELRQQLNEERAHSREQADKVFQLAEQGQKLAENAQTLHAMENVKPQLTDGKKSGFFTKLFSRGKQ